MSVRVGINGFGRIGRSVYRCVWERRLRGDNAVEVVAVNDLATPAAMLHLLRYDSIMGRFPGAVEVVDEDLVCKDGEAGVMSRAACSQHAEPQLIPWANLGVDVVIESSGVFTQRAAAAAHLAAGARKVIISAPSADADLMAVLGVNFAEDYDAARHDVISNASCTTTCLAPVAKVLHDNFSVVRGVMNTIHAYTVSQRLQDMPHKDPRRGRAGAVNLIPTSTGAAKAVAQVLPELRGKLNGFSVRAPVAAGSLVNFYCELGRDLTPKEVNAAFAQAAASTAYANIIQYTEDPIVSTDVIGSPYSAVFDAGQTLVVDGRLVTVGAWYDNEWGYSQRLVDTAALL